MKTATQFLTERYSRELNSFADNVEALVNFGRLCATEALKAAAEKATATIKYEYSGNTGSEYCDEWAVVDKNSILNSYNLNEIQ